MDFFNESMIEVEHLKEAVRLTSGVDTDDVAFVALTLHKNGWLWTGDKKLITHLKAMGFDRIITTGDLYEKIK